MRTPRFPIFSCILLTSTVFVVMAGDILVHAEIARDIVDGQRELQLRTSAMKEAAAAPAAHQEIRQLVGNLGRTRALQFSGNQSFPTDMLRKSLAKDLSFVLVSHPTEPLDRFLMITAERLRPSYINCGFPAAKVRTTRQPGNDDGTLVATTEEGPATARAKSTSPAAKASISATGFRVSRASTSEPAAPVSP